MGVPKFAAWLTKKYPAMVMDRCPADVHGLYIDLNGLIHPCCHDEHDATVALRTEVEKTRSICLAIETLVVTVRPQHVIYIAIDGVAPRAKMNQQRARRYMSAGTPLTNTEKPIHGPGDDHSAGMVAAIEKEFTAAERTNAERDLEDVNQSLLEDVLYGGVGGGGDEQQVALTPPAPEHTSPPDALQSREPAPAAAEGRFDSNCISPGTTFMDKVAAAVRDFVQRKMSPAAPRSSNSGGDPLTAAPAAAAASATTSPWANVTVVFSDSNTAGEGEHKFLDFLRTQSAFPGFNSGGCHVIAGLDADLIFLSLSLHIPRVVILRDHDRSSYEKALLPVSAGGTLTASKGKGKGKASAAAALPASDSTSSIGSAVAVATAATTVTTTAAITDVADALSTPLPSEAATPSSYKDDELEMLTEGRSVQTDSLASPTDLSPPASPVVPPPPHIAGVAVEACSSYEYYDMDVVGASLVSEVYQLCLEKGVEVRGNPLENPMNCVASNGFRFHHGGSGGGGVGGSSTTAPAAAAEVRPAEAKKPAAKRDAKTPTSSLPASASPAAPPPPPAFHPCTATSNSKIIDDFIVVGMLLGNDFLPHSPSVFCGESAMDTLLDVYVSAVLPYGYLTGGLYEIQLAQVERLFRAYAAVEAVRFRQRAIQAGTMTPQEAATSELYSAADRRCWRDTYVRTTSLKDEAGVQQACRAYVEGLRFVWRYYSSISLQVSWSWFYPFHHAPLALDVANFLRAQGPNVQTTLAAPRLERLPPPPFCQLLCILPPTSRLLVPAALRPAMVDPPQALTETFPKSWKVDFTAAYGKDHLAAVLLPFANLPDLQKLVQAHADTYSPVERARNALRSTHLVLESRTSPTANTISSNTTAAAAEAEGQPSEGAKDAPEKEKPRRAAGPTRARGFQIQGDGLRPLKEADVPAEMRGCPSIVCSTLADVAPPLSRPRTYSYTVAIPNLTVLPDGTRVPVERRPQNRYGNRRRPNNAKWEDKNKDRGNAAAASATSGAHVEKPSMLFGEFALALVIVGVVAAAVAVRRSTSLLGSLQVLLQLCGVAMAVLGLIFALGLAVASKGRAAGSGMRRHNIFTAFVDWQCASCLSLNFSRNRRCFMCRAPFDPHRCVALFSGRNAPEPPLMDPDHNAYAASYGIVSR